MGNQAGICTLQLVGTAPLVHPPSLYNLETI